MHAKSVQDLQRQNLLTKENYWIDIEAPSIAEMKIISKVCIQTYEKGRTIKNSLSVL